tara:strand:+ start:2890 stop:3183 length:294 start_codon:yes stop_codon:yes gene_type:complete
MENNETIKGIMDLNSDELDKARKYIKARQNQLDELFRLELSEGDIVNIIANNEDPEALWTVKKINIKRVVIKPISGKGAGYNCPFSMLRKAKETVQS